MTSDAATFLGIVLVLTITPGADMALVMRNVLAHGMRATWPTLLGIFSGFLVHVVACVAGLSVVLRDSEVAFEVVKLVGAAWLVWLGASAIVGAVRSSSTTQAATGEVEEARASFRALFVGGFLTNVLNVKIALFYIAFLPQFAPAGDRFVPVALGLAAVQMAIGFTWLTTYAWLVSRAGSALEANPRTRRWIEGSTGAALVGFGLRLAAASR